MSKLGKLYPTLLGDLALAPGKDNTAYGRRAGFPLGLKVVDPDGKGTVLFHARFPKSAKAFDRAQLAFDHTLHRLMQEKLAEVKVDSDIAFLSLRKAADRIEKREAVTAVDEFIAGLQRAGMNSGDDCHYCGSSQEVQTVFNGDRVGQICNACAAQQAAALMEERRFDAASVPKLLATALLVMPLLAAAWAAMWIGIDVLFTSQGGSMTLPLKIAGLVVCGLGLVAALPALLFRRVKNRGNIGAGLFGGACALLAAALGELVVSTFQVSQMVGQFSPVAGILYGLPMLLGGNGTFLLLRGIAFASFVGFAFAFTKPPKPKLNL